MQRTECYSSSVAQRLHSKLCLSPFRQHRNDYTYRHGHDVLKIVMRRLLRMQLFCHCWRISRSPQCTVCRQCTTYVRCGRCLSQFQICVCVSRLVRLLSVSKFSLRQSASTVTKSLSSPAGASCQSKEKREQLRVRILNNHENPALRHNRYFNIATAQRPHEAMHVFIRVNEICSRDTGLCSRWISVEY